MKEIKSIDLRSAFRFGLLFYGAVVGTITLVFLGAELLALLRGNFSVVEFLVGGFVLLVGAALYVLFGGATVAVSVCLYNRIARKYGGIKIQI